ncbi:MAG: CvpA family protein [Pseudomonadales bacterium]|nr:CvpA family protein [Pseudomonadales bacterium]
MSFADGFILAVVVLSMAMGLFRGLIREAFSLVSWVLAWLVARHYGEAMQVILLPMVPTPSLRLLAAFLILFIGTWLVMSLLSYLIQGVLDRVGLRWSDRMLGCVFGLLRGLLMVEVLLMLMAPYASHDPWWHQSRGVGVFMHYAPYTRELGHRVQELSRPVLSRERG